MSTRFASQLQRWGPSSEGRAVLSVREAKAYCRQLATSHYENFSVATWLLPRHLRPHFYNVYAFCRWSDDLADEVDGTEQSLDLLGWWRNELQGCYQGSATHPVFIALRDTVDQFAIPVEPFEHLISAFEQDQTVHEYQTFDDLLDYCRRSANPVGRLVLFLCGQHTENNVAYSDSICTGLQLANFWQDVSRDLDIGRIYLPVEDCQHFEYSRDQLRARTMNSAFIDLMRFQVERTRKHLLDGLPLVDRLSGRVQIDIEAFANGGLCILDRIEAIRFNVWDKRPALTRLDLLRVFAGCTSRFVARHLRAGSKLQRTPDDSKPANLCS